MLPNSWLESFFRPDSDYRPLVDSMHQSLAMEAQYNWLEFKSQDLRIRVYHQFALHA